MIREYYDSKIKLLEKYLEDSEISNDAKKSIAKQIADTKLAAVKGLVGNVDQFNTESYIEFALTIFQVSRGHLDCLIIALSSASKTCLQFDVFAGFLRQQ